MNLVNYNDCFPVFNTLVDMDGNKLKGEFFDWRIDPTTIPEGKHVYMCRHDDNGDWVTPVTIERRVWVNFCGTFITDAPLEFEHFIELSDAYYED